LESINIHPDQVIHLLPRAEQHRHDQKDRIHVKIQYWAGHSTRPRPTVGDQARP
jgi:hypothetical protein